MNKLMMGVKKFLRDEEGTEVVEWALVAGLIVAVGATIFVTIGDSVAVYLGNLAATLTNNEPAAVTATP